jgi:hypothetical protein
VQYWQISGMSEPAPEERFRKAMKKILSVPKAEILRREAEYRAGQASKKKSKGS